MVARRRRFDGRNAVGIFVGRFVRSGPVASVIKILDAVQGRKEHEGQHHGARSERQEKEALGGCGRMVPVGVLGRRGESSRSSSV